MFLSEIAVSLLVRLWVEIQYLRLVYEKKPRQPPCEAVSWNVVFLCIELIAVRQPPCEAVSWNFESENAVLPLFVSLLVRLWVEIKINRLKQPERCRQPPCEAVSWNVYAQPNHKLNMCQPPCEAVSWNTTHVGQQQTPGSVSLLVRLWVEMKEISLKFLERVRQPPCEAVSWNKWRTVYQMNRLKVSLLVRLWVEMLVM